jgi:DNA-binding MarR family transcriptional regulator
MVDTGPGKRDAGRTAEVAMRLHSAAIHLLRYLRRDDPTLGLSPARLSALSVVGFGGPRTLRALAAAEGVRPPTMARIVDALEHAGLVERRPDVSDRRQVQIAATDAGLALLREGQRLRAGRLARRLARLSAAEVEALAHAAGLIEALVEPADPAVSSPVTDPRGHRREGRDPAGRSDGG